MNEQLQEIPGFEFGPGVMEKAMGYRTWTDPSDGVGSGSQGVY